MNEALVAHYSALREGCGLWRGSRSALLALTGEDRVRLLDGLVTCEVKNLTPGEGVHGFFTDVKGHILADVVIRATQTRLWLELPEPVVSSVAAHIEKYIVVDRVEVETPADCRSLVLLGPGSAGVLSEVFQEAAVSTPSWSHLEMVLQDCEVLISKTSHFGTPAVSLWSTQAAIDEIAQRSMALEEPGDIQEVGSEAIEVVRVEEGIPRFGVDFGPENLPQETGIEDAVSYSKGCYLGQEVVARLHHRGQVARRLCRLQSLSQDLPPTGSVLDLDGRQAGTVTSAARSPVNQQISVLAMLQRRAMEKGTRLQAGDGGWLQVV